jgi:hypothetical protein
MNNYFLSIFKDSGLSEKDISGFLNDFTQIFFLTFLGKVENKLSEDECSEIKKYFEEGKIENIFTLIRQKFTDVEFSNLLMDIIVPLAKEYHSKVVEVK